MTILEFNYEADRATTPGGPGSSEYLENQWLSMRQALEQRNWVMEITNLELTDKKPVGEKVVAFFRARHDTSPVPVSELSIPPIQDFLAAMRIQGWAVISGGVGLTILIKRES